MPLSKVAFLYYEAIVTARLKPTLLTQLSVIKQRVLNENGEFEEVTETVETVYLTVIHNSKSALDTADEYNFTTQQDEMLAELLDDKNAALWQGLLTPAY